MKPTVLTFTAFYLPGYRGGGPIRTISNMVDRLSDDFYFKIVTADRDAGDSSAYPDIEVDQWNVVGRASVFYASPGNRSIWKVARLMRETPHNILYLNSFFSPRFTLTPLFAQRLRMVPQRTLIVAPRGEFSVGALGIKAWKKSPFVNLARVAGFFRKALWHASTDFEATDIQRVFHGKDARVHVARNPIVAPDLFSANLSPAARGSDPEKSVDVLRICFLSRIAPIKNLEFALRILSCVRARIVFNIYGPKEDLVYWESCAALIKKMPANIAVQVCGAVAHHEVRDVMSRHDVLFVPSLGENFGHVFMESLAAGVPILVSDQTPWRELTSHGVGWDIPLNQPDRFVDAIEKAAGMSPLKKHDIKVRCLQFAHEKAMDRGAVDLNRALFETALRLRA
jgi:glycosyltransferase involved in cell wall biosynthesis